MTEDETLRRRVGQLVIAGFPGLTVADEARQLIERYYVGNVILFSRNVHDTPQLQGLTQGLHDLANESGHDLPLTISCDQENGIVRRLPRDIPGLPGNMALAATRDPDNAFRAGMATGRLLASLGINVNLAPVLDVNNNPHNPVIGVRSFSDLPDRVAQYGLRFMEGLTAAGVIACAKHFPGHGDTTVDSHVDLPIIPHSREEMERVHLIPFQAAIAAGIDVMMTAHVVFPAMTASLVPATLAPEILTGLLRLELGFQGVLTTDCLEMNAIADTVGVAAGAVKAIRAGADMVMISHRLDRQIQTIDAIVAAVKTGDIPESRLDEAYNRVRDLKIRRLKKAAHAQPPWPTIITETQSLQQILCQKAVTALRLNGPTLPQSGRVAVLADEWAPRLAAVGHDGADAILAEALRQVLPQVTVHTYTFPAAWDCFDKITLCEKLSHYQAVVIGINGSRNVRYLAFIQTLAAHIAVPMATFLLRSPYDARFAPVTSNLWALYENTPWMAHAAIQAALGRPANGRLPVQISDAFPRDFRTP